MSVIKFFHHLFNPHCPDCIEETRCNSCDTLRDQLTLVRAENERLLRALLEANVPKVEVRQVPQDLQPISNRPIPWVQKQRMLEAESRMRAELLRAEEKARKEAAPTDSEVKKLEEELGVDNAS